MADPAREVISQSGTEGGTSPSGAVESSNHESSAISLRGIVIFTLWFILAVVVINLLIWWFFTSRRRQERSRDVDVTGVIEASRVPPPEPRLQPSPFHDALPRVDMEQMLKRTEESFAKRTPSWVDPQTKQVRIPEEIVNEVGKLSRSGAATTQQDRK